MKSTKKTKVKAQVKKTQKKTTKKSTTQLGAGVATAKSLVLVGKSVPSFEVPATGEKTVSLKQLKGKTVVLYFYPKDATPGCTIEGKDFTRLHSKFQSEGAEVFGISRDSIKSHEKFKTNQEYTVDLLSDEDENLCRIFGVIKMKNMYGRQVRGIERSTFVVDKAGTLVKEWRGVKVPGHAEEVLEFVKSL
jgi:thioredoxin-dependent peroxiredoxin